MLNVAYPAILLGAKTARLQRDLVFVLDLLDGFYAILPIWLMLMGCRDQSLILPHDPMTFCSNLVPLFHAHFVLSALEEARRSPRIVPRRPSRRRRRRYPRPKRRLSFVS